ncbi:GAF domain-containing protein [Tateyamaria sp.]|uniref:GAF domain-containing protein n=1 Tax=Tateyamaria sp. TaxID=1929288 RepID=UPI00329AFEEA
MSYMSIDFSNMVEFDALAQSIVAKLGCELCLVSVVHGETLTSLGHSDPGTPSENRSMSVRDTICERTVRTGQPLRLPDVRVDPELRNISSVRAMEIGAYLGVPLKVDGEAAVGAICAVSTTARIWRDSELAYLQAVADLAESRIERHLLRFERKALSDALAENDAILNMLSNVKGRGMTVHNADGELVFVNAAMKNDLQLNDRDMLALPNIARRVQQLALPFNEAHVVRSTPTNTELSVQMTAADNGLVLAEWCRDLETSQR